MKRYNKDMMKKDILVKQLYPSLIGKCKDCNKNFNDILLMALDSVNDGISFCDKNGYLLYVNNACCEIVGATKDELLNKKVDSLSPDKPMLIEVIEKKKSIIDIEYFWNFKGKKTHLINSGYPIFDENGDIIGAIDIFRSIERSRKLANTIAGHQAFFMFDDIIGESNTLKDVINLAKTFSKSNESILIYGETGTGKELFAQSIHNYSNRKRKPFVALNCANLPNELIDSELFGYEEGAFTGARKGGKPGKFELSNGGTLFLDELGEMQIDIQAKLLRVLETMCINRIGGNKPINVDVRIIAATNRNLEKMVEEGQFRRDLYYRLKVLCLEIPPLKEREDDILLLADYFVRKLVNKGHKYVKGIDDKAKEILMNHSWKGNIRELENVISRSMFICDGEWITEKTLFMAGFKEPKYEEIIKKESIIISKGILINTLNSTKGNKKKAAEILGISRPTLYKFLKKYDL